MQLNLIKNKRSDIEKIHLYVKDPFESNYQLHFNVSQEVGIKMLKNPKAFTDDSQTINNEYGSLEDHNPTKKRRVLIVVIEIW